MSMIQDPMAVFAVCALLCALVFWSAQQDWAKAFYRVVPSVVLVYYLPTLSTTFGIIPTSSPVYDWMRDYLLPASLFILMMTADVRAIFRIGPKALVVMLSGTLGVIIGGPIAFLIFKSWLDPDSWKALAALSGSWIGGGGNFAAIKESVGASDASIGPIIIVDTAVGYTWTGILLFLVNFQKRFDTWLRADSAIFAELNERLASFQERTSRPIRVADALATVALGFLGAVLCRELGMWLFEATDPVLMGIAPSLASIFSMFTWMVILITTLGIGLSFTRLRRVEDGGGSKIGYAALYLFLASLGAKADLAGLLSAPILLLVGAVWIAFHVIFLFAAARLLRAPLFLVAVGSQANIGGAATAPIVASAFYEALAPVGLLMGVMGYLVGTYGGLLCAFLLRLAAS
ncbi:MAG: DUF819 family protein [Acidobacteriota bacterium]|nr:MAG: DUF819 family protein [Acidobacteriota bacterium]